MIVLIVWKIRHLLFHFSVCVSAFCVQLYAQTSEIGFETKLGLAAGVVNLNDTKFPISTGSSEKIEKFLDGQSVGLGFFYRGFNFSCNNHIMASMLSNTEKRWEFVYKSYNFVIGYSIPVKCLFFDEVHPYSGVEMLYFSKVSYTNSQIASIDSMRVVGASSMNYTDEHGYYLPLGFSVAKYIWGGKYWKINASIMALIPVGKNPNVVFSSSQFYTIDFSISRKLYFDNKK